MAALRVAVVGCGGRGRGHIQALQGLIDVEVVALCDPVVASGSRAGDEFGITNRYATTDELLDGEQLDAAVVATPAHLNAATALPLLQAGIDTLLEKPPGFRLEETEALRKAALASGARGMVGWDRRFNHYIAEAREAVEARGPVLQLVGEFHKSMANFARSGRFPQMVMDNMLLESPIHAIDVVRAMAGGEVAEVHSVVRRVASDYKDVHAALVIFDNGCVAQLSANYTTDARLERYEIHGHGISAYLEGIAGGVLVADGQSRDLEAARENSTVRQDRFFIDCVRQQRPITLPAADLDEALKTMELAHKMLAGLRTE